MSLPLADKNGGVESNCAAGNCVCINAGATLTNWDGCITVDNSHPSTLLGGTQQTITNYNGQAEDESSDANNGDASNDSSSESDATMESSESNKATTSRVVEQHRTGGGGRQRDNRLYRSASHRSAVGGIVGVPGGGIDSTSRHSSSTRFGGAFSRQTIMSSSMLGDSMTEIVIEDLHEHEPTSAILDYCKRKFLRPYVRILSLVGLNPISTDMSIYQTCLSYMKAFIVLLIILFGYFLQYLCSYRGDRGFSNFSKILPTAARNATTTTSSWPPDDTPGVHTIGELLFGYAIPNILHLCGFISAVIVCKMIDQEQLQNLIERVFLMSMKPKRLFRILLLYLVCSLILFCLLYGYVLPCVLMQSQIVHVKIFMDLLKDYQLVIKIILLVTLFVQDLVEIIILSSYCIECYLLRVHLSTLSQKLLMHSIESLDWMREVLEFRKLLDQHLNKRVAIPVCFFTIMNLSYAFAGFVYLFNDFDFHYSALKVVILNIINVLLWLIMGLFPFFMAASVTRVCQCAQGNGHQIRVRPFVYHNTSAEDLNTTLLFASSLKMSAKLFRMPIQQNYLCFAILVVTIVILTLGMCLNLDVLGNF